MEQQFDWTIVIQLIQKGDGEAFSFLYEKTRDFIFHQIRYEYGFSEQDAEDILQEVYTSVHQNIGRLKNPNAVIVWISQICKNRCNEVYRKTSRRKEIAEVYNESDLATDRDDEREFSMDALCGVNNVEEYIERKEVQRLVGEMISELSQDQQICIVMRMQQYSVQEIAEQTGMKENTVKTNIRRAKEKVKAKVLELEKKGTKLYGLAPIPFFWWLLRKALAGQDGVSVGMYHADNCFAAASAAGTAASAGASAVGASKAGASAGAGSAHGAGGAVSAGSTYGEGAVGGVSATKAAAASAGKAAAGGFLSTATGKAVAIVAAVVIVAGGVTAGILIHNRNQTAEPQTQTAEVQTTEEQTAEEQTTEEQTTEKETETESEEPAVTRKEINAAFLDFLEKQRTETASDEDSVVSIEYGNDHLPPMIFYREYPQNPQPGQGLVGESFIHMAVYDKGNVNEVSGVEQYLDLFDGSDQDIVLSQPWGTATEDAHTEFLKIKNEDALYVYWRRAFENNYLDKYTFSDGKFHLERRIEGRTTQIGPQSSYQENNQAEIDEVLENATEKMYVSLFGTSYLYGAENRRITIPVIKDEYTLLRYDQAISLLSLE